MSKTYKLSTLRDVYDHVPRDKIELCMREIAEGMIYAKDVAELLDTTAQVLGGAASTFWPNVCEWIDDGLEDKSIRVVDDTSNEVMFTMRKSAADD